MSRNTSKPEVALVEEPAISGVFGVASALPNISIEEKQRVRPTSNSVADFAESRDVRMWQAARSRLHSLMLGVVGVSIIILSAQVLAGDSPATGPTQLLPPTVTLKTDMVFHVPFSVTGDTVPVTAGTQVSLKGVRDKYLKLAYGPAELTVDPAQTDFAERMKTLPRPPTAAAVQLPPRRILTLTSPQTPSMLPSGDALPSSSPENKEAKGRLSFWKILIYIVALLFVLGGLGALVEWAGRFFRSAAQQRRIELAVSGYASHEEIRGAVEDLDWFQFEKLICAVFRAQGHHAEMRGGANADGGIDLVIGSGATRTAVQCKHWGSWKCAPKIIRELLGAMTHEQFAQGILVCRSATPAAHSLASQERITIIEQDSVVRLITDALAAESAEVRRLLFAPEKLCPKCGALMVRRTAARGSNVGSEFWGCSKYPDCRQTMRV